MSKHSFGWLLLVATCVFMAGIVAPQLIPKASGQQVLPGGRPAKIQSFYASVASDRWLVVIPTVPGEHGMIIQNLHTNDTGTYELQVNLGGDWVTAVLVRGSPQNVVFVPGIPVPAGASVRLEVASPTELHCTAIGYTY